MHGVTGACGGQLSWGLGQVESRGLRCGRCTATGGETSQQADGKKRGGQGGGGSELGGRGGDGGGLALVAEAAGETERAIAMLAEARARSGRLAEPYLWLDGYILDAQCDLGRRHDHPETAAWVEALRTLASRSGMRELTLRSLQHGAALGRPGDSTAAAVLADELAENR